MKRIFLGIAACAAVAVASVNVAATRQDQGPSAGPVWLPEADQAYAHAQARLNRDLVALQLFRPGYTFWRHIFTVPDGAVAYGSAVDGRLLAVFPARGDWAQGGRWEDATFAEAVAGVRFERDLDDRREQVARLLEPMAGPVMHNATRGNFVLPNVRRYGSFLDEWGAIYERFGVPAEIGLAQVLVESGFNGTTRSEARAFGFCQWLEVNWRRLQRLTPHVIEGRNQTTQAPYCAAYLTILATKYGSFIPALSEHHAGGTNVGRTVITGARLGGIDSREQYLLGAELTRDLRIIAPRAYSDLYGTYGPRSFLYAEMVFGNVPNVTRLSTETPQVEIHAMRVPRAIPLAEITRGTGLSVEEVRRFNPALVRQVPARATLYLPRYVKAFGPDVAFWHRSPSPSYAAVLNDFVRLDAPFDAWDAPPFLSVLRGFQTRFRETGTEEGVVMSAVLGYVIDDIATSGRGRILEEFRTSDEIRTLVARGVEARETARAEAQARAAGVASD